MRRFLLLLLLLCSLLAPAWAERFDGALPAAIAGCLTGSVFEADAVEQGATLAAQGRETVLLALLHGDTRLLAAATRPAGGTWHCYPVTELLPAEDFTLSTGTFRLTGENEWFTLTTAAGTFYLAVDPQDAFWVGFDSETDGRYTAIDTRQMGALRLTEGVVDGRASTRSLRCAFNPLSEVMELASFPTTAEAVEAYARSHPLRADTSLRVIGGMNLRAEPTSRSESIAVYRTPVLAVYLDEAPGLVEPWIQVQVGQDVGWVSASYVYALHEAGGWPLGVGLPIGETRWATPLTDVRGGDILWTLPAGTLVHVLTQDRDGAVQVSVPTATPTDLMDTDGLIGWVETAALRIALSPLQWKYGIWEGEK